MTVPPTTDLKRMWSEQSPVTPTKRPRLDYWNNTTASQRNVAIQIRPIILADCPEHQSVWNKLPVGTLYEVARIATKKSINLQSIPKKQLEKLCDTNVVSMSRLLDVLGCGPVHTMEKQTAEALDFEALSIVAGDGRMLEHEMESKHISGRVHFTVALSMEALIQNTIKSPTKSSPQQWDKFLEPDAPVISLRPPMFGVSCLFSRVFGSHRFLCVKILDRGKSKYSSEACLTELTAWSLRPIYIFGRQYRAFADKEDTIWYYLQGKDFVGQFAQDAFQRKPGQYGTQICDTLSLVYWWIPLDFNGDQLMCKLSTRLHLGISGTRPGPLVANVELCKDIVREVDGTKVVFTDGSGVMSKELSTKVWAKCATGKPEPAAYQIRLSTSKGVVQVAPDIEDRAPNDEWIQITQSMLKAKQKDNVKARLGGRMTILDAAHYVACVVKSATCRYPARLSFQLIPILCEQGVPLSAIKGLQKRTVDATINDLRIPPQGAQDGNMAFPKAIQRYANLVYNTLLENGEGSPKEKEAWKQEKKWRLDELISSLETEDGNVSHADIVLCRNAQLYLAVTSGLNIRSSAYFMEIWKSLIEKAVKTATMSFKIEVPGSVYCTIVPDFTGKLEEGEISFSVPKDLNLAHLDFTAGEVLVGRHPAYLPTDVRKVRLANVPALRSRRGVIYFSTKGRRPLADLLAGGDYDGDDVILIWEPSLVAEFENADDRLSEKPPSVEASFEREPITAGDVHNSLENLPDEAKLQRLTEHLLGSLKVPKLFGLYNSYFIRAVHLHGISSLEARTLGHMFGTLIDAPRTAFRLKREAKIKDLNKWGNYEDPLWKKEKDKYERGIEENPDAQLLPKINRINVLDELYRSGRGYYRDAWRQTIDTDGIYDPGQREKLASPWIETEKAAKKFPEMIPELDLVKSTVQEGKRRFTGILSKYGGKGRVSEKNAEFFELAHWFANNPPADQVPNITGRVRKDALDAVKASYAFILDSTTSTGAFSMGSTSGFCWMMAIAPLLSSISSSPITLSFGTFSKLTPHSSFCEAQEDDRS